jgi:uncharacterized protein (TIGR03067 family)
MKLHALTVLTASLLIAAGAPEDAKKELDRLKGTWSVTAAESEGQKAPEEEVRSIKMTFSADKMTINQKGKDLPMEFRLDPTKKPRTIDIVPTEGAQKGKVIAGIYQLDGDELKLCLSRPGKEQRPTEFATKAGSESVLLTLKRDKP